MGLRIITGMTEHDVRHSFAVGARWFGGLVDRVPVDAWSGPGLGVWDVRALTGHGTRSLVTVNSYLDRPAAEVQVATPWDYYLQVMAAATDAAAVAERGRQAGKALGAEPAAFVRALVERVLARVPADDPVIETIVGGMRLSDYLPTRTFELVVHGYDLAAAVDLTAGPLPEDVLAEVLGLAGRIAVRTGQGPGALLALTGRTRLPAGFSVV